MQTIFIYFTTHFELCMSLVLFEREEKCRKNFSVDVTTQFKTIFVCAEYNNLNSFESNFTRNKTTSLSSFQHLDI